MDGSEDGQMAPKGASTSYVRISHTNPGFAEAAAVIDERLCSLFDLAEKALDSACRALRERDLELARAVVAADKKVNELEAMVAEGVATAIARYQPVARDVHALIGSIQLAQELERIADHAKSTCRRLRHLDKDWEHAVPYLEDLDRLGLASLAMLREFIAAAAVGDQERVGSVWRRDEKVNERYKQIMNRLLKADAAEELRPFYNLFSIGKHFERVGDRVKNLAEITHYQSTGTSHDFEEEEHETD